MNIVYFERRIDNRITRIKGLKSETSGYYYPWIEFNHFQDNHVKIPKNFKRIRAPKRSFILKAVADPRKHRLRKTTFTPYFPEWYAVEDNGSTPYIVYINNKNVYIYRVPKNSYVMNKDWSTNSSDNLCYFTEIVFEFHNVKDTMIGIDYVEKRDGNSILLRLDSKKYLYIGDCMYTFTSDEKIHSYFSNLGNSSVPYPIGISDSYVYFMLDKVYVDKREFPNVDFSNLKQTADIYSDFYQYGDSIRKTRIPHYRLVKKRLL
jgi:hypothetical protein